jgi:hypothetical protein
MASLIITICSRHPIHHSEKNRENSLLSLPEFLMLQFVAKVTSTSITQETSPPLSRQRTSLHIVIHPHEQASQSP